MSHHDKEKRKKREICDRPSHFRDSTGKGKLDSTPIIVPPDFKTEVGSSLDLPATSQILIQAPLPVNHFIHLDRSFLA